MSRTLNTLKTLEILEDNLYHKSKEIALKLECSIGMIRYYMDDIEGLGRIIERKRGCDGGYRLVK